MPLGITVASKDLMSWPPGSHGNTFGGNPVSCAAALATIDLIEEQLLENTRKVGAFMAKELEAMVARHRQLGWVNGMGLMLAVEVVEPGTNHGDHDRRDEIIQACFERGLLTLGAGPSAVRISPPLTLTRAQAQVGLEILDEAVSAVELRGKRGRGATAPEGGRMSSSRRAIAHAPRRSRPDEAAHEAPSSRGRRTVARCRKAKISSPSSAPLRRSRRRRWSSADMPTVSSGRELAVMSASHNGAAEHVSGARHARRHRSHRAPSPVRLWSPGGIRSRRRLRKGPHPRTNVG
jgi:hypothetical protein